MPVSGSEASEIKKILRHAFSDLNHDIIKDKMVFILKEVHMSPGFRNVLCLVRFPPTVVNRCAENSAVGGLEL